MNLVTLTQEDNDDILGLLKLAMPSIYDDAVAALTDTETWEKRVMWGDRHEGGGALVSCCGLYDDENISWFAVDPYWQRTGLGKRMLDFLIDKCEADTLYVETYIRPDFASANAFYLKNGFELSGFTLPDTIYYKLELL